MKFWCLSDEDWNDDKNTVPGEVPENQKGPDSNNQGLFTDKINFSNALFGRHAHVNATVLLAACRRVIAGHRMLGPVSLRLGAVGHNSDPNHFVHYRPGPLRRQLLVHGRIAARVGVAPPFSASRLDKPAEYPPDCRAVPASPAAAPRWPFYTAGGRTRTRSSCQLQCHRKAEPPKLAQNIKVKPTDADAIRNQREYITTREPARTAPLSQSSRTRLW